MNLGGKQDLDALLRSWPAAPPKGLAGNTEDERAWDERADAIVRAAEAARKGAATDATAALFEAPALAPEAGEEAITAAVGEKNKMSQEKESGDSPSSTGTPMPSQPPKRQSLKEIAARASQSGARLSQPGAAPPSVPASARVSTPTPLPRPVEAGKEDSGVINLKVVHDTATAQQRVDAEKAKPAQAGLFEDEKTVESASVPVAPTPAKPTNVAILQPKKSNSGAIGGVVIAVLGIAAAFAIVSRNKPLAPPPAPLAQQAEDVSVKKAAAPAAPAPVASAAPAEVASAAPVASAEPDKAAEAAKPALGGPLPSGAATAGAATPGTAVAVKGPLPSGKPGDLQSEMAKAVGKDGQAAKDDAPGPTPEPAAAKNQNIPEQPSQGAVAAAFGPVMGSAKACVSGADDVSRASVTFSSAGSVTSVSVSGWAAANGKSGCIQAALKAAKVGPFSKPSFTVGVPIRP